MIESSFSFDRDTISGVLMIGQSNMAGHGEFGEVEPILNDRYFMLRKGRRRSTASSQGEALLVLLELCPKKGKTTHGGFSLLMPLFQRNKLIAVLLSILLSSRAFVAVYSYIGSDSSERSNFMILDLTFFIVNIYFFERLI